MTTYEHASFGPQPLTPSESTFRRFRWLILPAVGAAAAAAFAVLQRRARRPALTPMSDDWLRQHGVDAGRQPEL